MDYHALFDRTVTGGYHSAFPFYLDAADTAGGNLIDFFQIYRKRWYLANVKLDMFISILYVNIANLKSVPIEIFAEILNVFMIVRNIRQNSDVFYIAQVGNVDSDGSGGFQNGGSLRDLNLLMVNGQGYHSVFLPPLKLP